MVGATLQLLREERPRRTDATSNALYDHDAHASAQSTRAVLCTNCIACHTTAGLLSVYFFAIIPKALV